MKTWNIYRLDGSYVGQSQARKAEVAFLQYTAIFRNTITLSEISAEEIEPGVCKVTFEGVSYILRAAR